MTMNFQPLEWKFLVTDVVLCNGIATVVIVASRVDKSFDLRRVGGSVPTVGTSSLKEVYQ